MKLCYVAHPVSGDVPGNLARARRWLLWLYRECPGYGFVADWILRAELLDDDDTERAMDFCLGLLVKCDAIVLVGGRISDGMARERTCAVHHGLEVMDLTWMGEEPPTGVAAVTTMLPAMAQLRGREPSHG